MKTVLKRFWPLIVSLISLTCAIAASSISAHAQTDDKPICISRQAAETCATNAERIKALEAQIQTLEQALKDKDGIINGLKTEVALKTGQIISNEQTLAQNRAIIEALLKMVRPKKFGIINF